MGDEAGAAKDFQALKKLGDRVAYQQAEVRAQWGDKEAALEALELAVRVRDPGIMTARMDPLLIPLHGDSRYTAVLKQMKLV